MVWQVGQAHLPHTISPPRGGGAAERLVRYQRR